MRTTQIHQRLFHLLLSSCVFIGISLAIPKSFAGPISYQGGWMWETSNLADKNQWKLFYTPRPWFSLGAEYLYLGGAMTNSSAQHYTLARTNFLIKRWNRPSSQGNIYLQGGLGSLHQNSQNSLAWQAALEGDWETREVYTSAKVMYVDSKDSKADLMYQARFGLAPYVTKFENLHTWVIFQVQYEPNAANDKLRLTPLMRFYINSVLWELGVSSKGQWLFNTMTHF